MFNYILIAASSALIGFVAGLSYLLDNQKEQKRIGELYIFDPDIDTEFGPSLLVQLNEPLNQLDLKNGEIVTMKVMDRRVRTRK